jgi:hypothetical protein
VIAVPTSVGYGASLGGVAALLCMLNACAPNITVTNIDNGFGAGYVAASSIGSPDAHETQGSETGCSKTERSSKAPRSARSSNRAAKPSSTRVFRAIEEVLTDLVPRIVVTT